MKKEKLLVKEIVVLSEVISKKVSEERKKRLENLVKKDKGYVSLMKKIEEFNEDVKKLVEREEKFKSEIKSIVERLGIGYKEGSIGNLNYSNVFGYSKNGFSVSLNVNSCYSSEVYNRLMIENIDGDLKVNDLIDRMVKEFV
jgi:hypothetical protein